MQRSVIYTILFAIGVCVICSVFVAGSAVSLKPLQEANKLLDRQKKVLVVAGLMQDGEQWSKEKISETFDSRLKAKVIELKTGKEATGIKPESFDQRKSRDDASTSRALAHNPAQLQRLAHHALVYHLMAGPNLEAVIIPVEGKGLWSTLYGYLAINPDLQSVKGITFYEHGETPGLGGEVDNPKWKARWPGRKLFSAGQSEPKIEVIKGSAGTVDADPYRVDGLSGATITSRGVSHLIRFWLGQEGFGPYLSNLKAGGN
jgi:Na+-transporting NADH:ubiquinone oxidoreductase subunit C